MTLDFWPFNRETKRRQAERDEAQERVDEVRTALEPKTGGSDQGILLGGEATWKISYGVTKPCAECGGIFIEDKLKPVTVMQVFSPPKHPVITEKFFCPKCRPVANIEIELMDKGGNDSLDTAYFSTLEHWLQPFNLEGVEQTFIAADEFGLLYCGDCDNLINTKRQCRKCSTNRRRR